MLTPYNYKNNYIETANDDITLVDAGGLYVPDTIRALVQRHKTEQLPRLVYLESYYLNRNVDILKPNRRVETVDENKADHRATHNYARYVSQFIVGYLTGNPITITHPDKLTEEAILELNDDNDADAVNSEIALNLSIYGRAYEIIYRNEMGRDKFMALDPKNTFVVYDSKIDKSILGGIRYYDVLEQDGATVEYAEVYTATDNSVYAFREGQYKLVKKTPHFYKDVQINAYINDKFKQGDYENVISLIDLYDASQSDTANYMTDLNDAMLAIVGNVDIDGDDAMKFRQANMVRVKPGITGNGAEGHADVKYIYKQYDVGGSEAYKTRLENDIHKFTNTPDLNDENFGGVQSGEAMKYKLFGLEQKRATKERYFKQSVLRRYKLLLNNKNIEGAKKHNYLDTTVSFSPNLPKAIKESVEIFNNLSGGVSEKTRMSMLPFIDDPEEELKQMKKEQNDRQQDLEKSRPDIYAQVKVGADNAEEKQ